MAGGYQRGPPDWEEVFNVTAVSEEQVSPAEMLHFTRKCVTFSAYSHQNIYSTIISIQTILCGLGFVR